VLTPALRLRHATAPLLLLLLLLYAAAAVVIRYATLAETQLKEAFDATDECTADAFMMVVRACTAC
jgi:hypothetical protein